MVETSPPSLQVPDVSPYNQVTVTCTASAEVGGETVPLALAVEWTRQSGSDGASSVPSTEYETTGSPEDGYQSTLTASETDTENTISYRCRANLVVDGSIQERSDTDLTVVGKTCTCVVRTFFMWVLLVIHILYKSLILTHIVNQLSSVSALQTFHLRISHSQH